MTKLDENEKSIKRTEYKIINFGIYSHVILKNGDITKIDNDILEKLNGKTIYCAIRKNKNSEQKYVRIIQKCNGKTSYINLHQMVIGNSGKKGGYRLVDHINGNSLDNRRENLRYVSSQINIWNSKKITSVPTSSKYKGVHWISNRKHWRSCIRYNKKSIYLGSCSDEINAAVMYDMACIKYRKGIGTNFPYKLYKYYNELQNLIKEGEGK